MIWDEGGSLIYWLVWMSLYVVFFLFMISYFYFAPRDKEKERKVTELKRG